MVYLIFIVLQIQIPTMVRDIHITSMHHDGIVHFLGRKIGKSVRVDQEEHIKPSTGEGRENTSLRLCELCGFTDLPVQCGAPR